MRIASLPIFAARKRLHETARAVKNAMSFTALKNAGRDSGIFGATSVVFALAASWLFVFLGGKTAAFPRRERRGVLKCWMRFGTPPLLDCNIYLRKRIFYPDVQKSFAVSYRDENTDQVRKKSANQPLRPIRRFGADNGNRTRRFSLGSWGFTTRLYPQIVLLA